MQGGSPSPNADLRQQRDVVDAFLAALRNRDFDALVAVLDPDLVVRADAASARAGAPAEEQGASNWASQAIVLSQGAVAARPALVNGAVGVIVAPRGQLFRVLSFTLKDGKIASIDVIGDPERLRQLDLAVL
jgi:RNA polymerase sigma-70 factor (ECF subfamily)